MTLTLGYMCCVCCLYIGGEDRTRRGQDRKVVQYVGVCEYVCVCVRVCVCACACAYAHVCMTVDALCVSTYKTVVVDNFALLHGTKSYIQLLYITS